MSKPEDMQGLIEGGDNGTDDARAIRQEVKAEGGSTVSRVIQVVFAPFIAVPNLWSSGRAFVTKHWPVLFAILVTDGILISLYLCFRDRYLIESFVGIGTVILATLAILGWFGLSSRRRQRAFLWGANLGVSLLFVGMLAWQARQIIWPTQFPSQVFGIAVARFGEGAGFRGTSLARDVTDVVIRGLREATQGNPNWDGVAVLPVGLVSDDNEAREWGYRVRADLVVWGQVVMIGKGNVYIYLQILETADRASSPAFPLVLPARARFAQSSVVEASLQPDVIKRLASQQSQIVTAFSLGLAAYFKREYATAVRQFQAAAETIEIYAGNSDQFEGDELGLVYFYLGRSYQRLGKLETGEECLYKAADYMSEDPAIPLSIAYGRNSLGREDEAQGLAREVIDMATDWLREHPDDVVVAYDRGLAYGLLDEPLRAADEFDAIILEKEPEFYVAYLSAGLAYLEAGDIDQAIRRFESAVEQAESSNADSSWGYLYLADAYNKAGEFKKADEFYQYAVELAPDVDWMHLRQGEFYESQGEINAAQQSYERVIEVAYDKGWAHAVMGGFFRRQSLWEKAIEEYLVVRRERPFDTLSLVYLAEVYLKAGKLELARQTYKEALELTPDFGYGRISFGVALVEMGDFPEAITQFRYALELNPTNGVARFDLGRAYESNGQVLEALAEYQTLVNAPQERYLDYIRRAAQERIDVLLTSTSP